MPRALSSLVAVAATLLLCVGASGCSSDDGPAGSPTTPSTPTATGSTGSTAERTEALAALYADDSTSPEDVVEARCFAEAFQQRLDQDALSAAGILGPDGAVVDVLPVFDEATAGAWVDAQLSCVDYVEASTRAMTTQSRGGLDAEAYATCLRAALSDEEVRAALVQTLSGGFDSPEVATLAQAQADCAA